MVEDVTDLYLVRECTIKSAEEDHPRHLCNPRVTFDLESVATDSSECSKIPFFLDAAYRLHKPATGHSRVLRQREFKENELSFRATARVGQYFIRDSRVLYVNKKERRRELFSTWFLLRCIRSARSFLYRYILLSLWLHEKLPFFFDENNTPPCSSIRASRSSEDSFSNLANREYDESY